MIGIRKGTVYPPIETYIALKGKVGPEDMMLVVLYEKNESEGFQAFEKKMLLNNPMFTSKLETKTHSVYLFNFQMHQNDWFNFIMGKYSKLSSGLKNAIKLYYGDSTKGYMYMESYLFPQKHFDKYAELLNVDVDVLKKIGELCDGCDLEKETLVIPVDEFVILDKSRNL
jgi:hypothetical protein